MGRVTPLPSQRGRSIKVRGGLSISGEGLSGPQGAQPNPDPASRPKNEPTMGAPYRRRGTSTPWATETRQQATKERTEVPGNGRPTTNEGIRWDDERDVGCVGRALRKREKGTDARTL